MKTETIFSILNAFCIGLVLLGVAWAMLFIGVYKGMIGMQEEAVKAGVAEWAIEYSDKSFSDVHRVFRWKVKP